MSRQAPHDDIDESDLIVTHPEDHAAGPTAVAVSVKRALEGMGVRRTARTLLELNQADGFDCQGCAWPDPSPAAPPVRALVAHWQLLGTGTELAATHIGTDSPQPAQEP